MTASSGTLASGENIEAAKAQLLSLLAQGAQEVSWYHRPHPQLASLVKEIAAVDHVWLLRCIAWLRAREGFGSAAIVMAADLVHARLNSGDTDNRAIIRIVLNRADEPGLFLAYWITAYGRPVPKPVQRGVADAVRTLYTADTAAEFDRPASGLRFKDVLSIARPRPTSAAQAELFQRLAKNKTDTTNPLEPRRGDIDPDALAALDEAVKTGHAPF